MKIKPPFNHNVTRREKAAILAVLQAGEDHGYGNLMAWLATAWAAKLIVQGVPEKDAILAVSNRGPYPPNWIEL